MASFQVLVAVVFVSAVAFQSCLVHGNFYNDMYFNWGGEHSSIFGSGDDLNLVLDKASANWWTSPIYNQLNWDQQGKLKWVRDNYMIYNYCTDYERFNWQMAPECSKPQY
ncbi:Concanavalin A-like lectin/glucanase superfamily [Cynara cardunculus var. scolymus]|uniref:Concanavalin A-like lectin/glucanase superfamily n=1 Tax=Cynara cardunculus var. scolymus TaxID=59895 RepID=A0A103YM43_CYNCS|nr:Concanavalin A-like lectin/glucanase superfamily [Cynara cardunculus var. scolymus]